MHWGKNQSNVVLEQTQFVGSKFGIFGGFVVRFDLRNLGLEGFEVRFFQIWAWFQPISGQKSSMFGHFLGFEVRFW